MNAYSKYKPTDIDWIGEIPSHWDVKKLKFIGNCTLGKMLTNDDKGGFFLKPYLRAQNIRWFSVDVSDTKEMWFSPNEIQKLSLEKNDLLVSEGGEVGRTCIWQKELDECYIQNSVHRVRFEKSDSRYYLYHFFFSGQKGYFDSVVNKISIGHLTGEKLKDLDFVFPPKAEQTTIANFLDEKTLQIDKLIANKQKLIELLIEEKRSIVEESVLKGKGKWKEKKLKYVARIQSSNVDKKSHEDETPILLCNYMDVYKNEFIDDSISFMNATASEKEIEKFILKEGDVLITKDSETPDDIANPTYVKQDFENVICGYHLAQIRPNKTELIGEYLFRLFQSKEFNVHFEISANGVTRYGLPLDAITDVFIPLPPVAEQKEIAKHIFIESKRIDETVSKIEREIELMQEYRMALISEVVTGKIKITA